MGLVALVVLVTGLLFLVAGVPLALAARHDSDGWIALLIDSLLFGIVAGTLGVTLFTWLGLAGTILALLGWLGLVWLAIRRFRSGRSGSPARTAFSRPQLPILVAWIIVGIVAVGYRLQSSNFLPWIGDMGAYVNWANQFATTGALHAGWPPVFPVFLGISGALFGTANVTAGLPLTGLALILVVTRILRQFHINRWVVVATAGAIALNLHAIWFSGFPASESLSAPMFLLWALLVSMVIRADRRELPVLLALTGIQMLELSLLRGSGTFLLVPVLVICVLAIVVPHWRALANRLWLILAVNVAGFAIAYWYGVTKIPTYFVETQVHAILKEGLFDLLQNARLLAPGPILVATLVIGTAIPFVIWWLWIRPLVPAERGFRATRSVGLIAAILVLAGTAGLVALRLDTGAILARLGLWYVLLAAIGIALVARRRIADDVTAVACLLAATLLVLIPFQTPRLGHDRPHAFFLYWDRYLFSEIFPCLLVLAGIAAGLIVTAIAARRPQWAPVVLRRGGIVAAALAAVVVLASASYSIPQRTLVTQHTYLQGAYAFTAGLDRAIPAGSAKIPLVWGATDETTRVGFYYPNDWIYPNTWMAFAIPLERSFGLDFRNVSRAEDNFGPDEVLTAKRLEGFAACGSSGQVLAFETQVSGPSLDKRITTPGIRIEKLHESTSDIDILTQPPTNNRWQSAKVPVALYRVTVDPALTAGIACAKPTNRPVLQANTK